MEPLTSADLAQLATRGLTPEAVAAQLHQLRHPPRPISLDRPCTVGDGIIRLEPALHPRLLDRGDEVAAAGRVTKFVPASGAATRMFKDLLGALQGPARPSSLPAVRELIQRLHDLPFGDEVSRRAGLTGVPETEADERRLLRTLLIDMRLAEQPKALVPFHRSDRNRTAFEEQLLEGTRYTRAADGTCRLHFTVSPDARALFEAALTALTPIVESRCPGAVLAVTFSEQHPSTDTVAIDSQGLLFRNADGSLVFRPSGHGALLRNLQDLGADLVVVKNIDNVLPDNASADVIRWKRMLLGYLADLQDEAFRHLRALHEPGCTAAQIDAALAFARRMFARVPPETCSSPDEWRRFAIDALDRPLRICGVVRNEGEPGGAPFWVKSADGPCTAQIVEASQVAMADPEADRVFRSATHFNPVDLVCGLRTWRGTPFDLSRFVDDDTAFVVEKSDNGRALKALERPGLWNGAMAGWNTVCVEVPAATFAPVKTVFDLLRPQHQPRNTVIPAAQ
ncbi:MAG: DUF4301 family protein [Vicinamibacterales bacterium]